MARQHRSANRSSGKSTDRPHKPAGADQAVPIHTARAVAAEVLTRVIHKRQGLDQAFDLLAAGLEPRDRAFARDLTLTSVRRAGSLRDLLKQLVDKPPPAGFVQGVLLTALAQVLIMEIADHAAVSESVDLMKASRKGKPYAGLTNAVLRRAIRERETWQAFLAKDPLIDLPFWIKDRWVVAYGVDDTRRLAEGLRVTPPLDLSLKPDTDKAALLSALRAEGYEPADLPGHSVRLAMTRPDALPGFEEGDWWVQDIAAQLPVRLLGDVSGQQVVDLCAAPGGKTMQLAAGGAHVTAVDRSKKRLERVADNLDRTGLSADIIAGDATKWTPPQDSAIDAVLIDAPCSALGTYRRNPDGMWTKGPDDVEKLARLQAELLAHAVDQLKPGGRALYCVCSLDPQEGVEQITAFLADRSDVTLDPIDAGEDGLLQPHMIKNGMVTVYSANSGLDGGADGFFIARLKRV